MTSVRLALSMVGIPLAGNEDDILRPTHFERCHLANALGESPAAKMFHRPDIGRLGTRPEPRDDQPWLDDQAWHASVAPTRRLR